MGSTANGRNFEKSNFGIAIDQLSATHLIKEKYYLEKNNIVGMIHMVC